MTKLKYKIRHFAAEWTLWWWHNKDFHCVVHSVIELLTEPDIDSSYDEIFDIIWLFFWLFLMYICDNVWYSTFPISSSFSKLSVLFIWSLIKFISFGFYIQTYFWVYIGLYFSFSMNIQFWISGLGCYDFGNFTFTIYTI